MIKQLFIDLIENKKDFLEGINSGNEFENVIEYYLINILGLNKICQDDINDFSELKELAKDKVLEDDSLIDNYKWKELEGCFLAQPFGTQSYPDFIIFSREKIIILEIKFTASNNNPMWNSGFPRNTGIYIYGNTFKKDITFFLGNDALTNKERIIMLDFFQDLKKLEEKVNNELLEHDIRNTGFQVYIRKAFVQKNTMENTEVSFLGNSKRSIRENNVLSLFS